MWRRVVRIIAWVLASAVAAIAVLFGAFAWSPLPRTPAELLRYVERRLDGHPRLEPLSELAISQLRVRLPAMFADRDMGAFKVPPPPRNVWDEPRAPQNITGEARHVIQVGPSRSVRTLSHAARVAKDGALVEVDPGDYVADVAVWLQKSLTIRGVGSGARLIAAGAHAEGKGTWVIRNGNFVVENIMFAGARVPDRNGAGIRFEAGHLVVRNCVFHGNQTGLLVGDNATATLEVENSEFGFHGLGDGQSHGIYAGAIARLKVTGSYFHHGNVGHHVKSRARETYISYSRLSDELGGRSSYEIDVPNGGVVSLIGNLVQQGAGQQNSVMVSFGAEGYRWSLNELHVVHNTLVNDESRGGSFVRARSGADRVQVLNNLLVGRGRVDLPNPAESRGNLIAEWSDFKQAMRYDYRPTLRAAEAWSASALAEVPVALQPTAQYVHPARSVTLNVPPRIAGAQQP